MDDIKAFKKEIRAEVCERIAGLDADYLRRSDAGVMSAVTAMPEFTAAETVFAYYSVGREVNTHSLIEMALELGKNVALPIVFGGGHMEYGLIDAGTAMESGSLNIPEPGRDAERIEPQKSDIVLVPALCYDKDGYRLGQGGGYYDRLLSSCPAYTIGLGRSKLLCEAVPREIHDLPVKCLVTETGIIKKYRISRH